MPWNPTKPNHIYLIHSYKVDFILNNRQRLISYAIKPNQTKPQTSNIYVLKKIRHKILTWLLSAFTWSVEPASSGASTTSRAIATQVCWFWARSHEMASQSQFHRLRPTTWGPDSAARSSLIVLAHVFSCPPTELKH